MRFAEIDRTRRQLGATQRDLCRRADITERTYCRMKRLGSGNTQTVEKLEAALRALAAERGAAADALQTNGAAE